ncbi:effector-associated constant component EACC1 [Dactylosporangium salmoneum]|uniref:Uncharacterized protein n=1 Tax=Dactylosporangium salmoneum TaxID=53361 RepID=A0ABP5UQH5_9ACTN
MTEQIELEVSDPAVLRSLRTWLEAEAGVAVTARPQPSRPGEQGAVDILTAVASTTALAAAVRMLPEFIRSRRSKLSVRIKTKGQDVTMTLENSKEVAEILDRILNR